MKKLIATQNIYENKRRIILKGKIYLIYSIFESDTFDCGKGCVVFGEDDSFHGVDYDIFKTEKEIKAEEFNL